LKDKFLESTAPLEQVSKRAAAVLSEAWGSPVPMCRVTVVVKGRQPEVHVVTASELEQLEKRYDDEPVQSWDVQDGFAQAADPEDETR
jgi:hypothetical protein